MTVTNRSGTRSIIAVDQAVRIYGLEQEVRAAAVATGMVEQGHQRRRYY